MKYYYLTIALFIACANGGLAQKLNVPKAFHHAGKQTELLYHESETADKGPKNELVIPRTVEKGNLKLVRSRDWTSGFFPGVLWYLYKYSQDEKWLQAAKKYTAKLEKEQFNSGTHDLGFMIYCSFGNGFNLTGNEE